MIKRFRSAQQAQVKMHNNKINFKHFKIKNKIMFFTKNLKNARFKKKLFYKFIKLFDVKNVVKLQTYRLRLFNQWKIYFVFHVFFSNLYYINANIVISSKMILVNENENYKIKNILKNKKKWEKFYYFVRWKEFFLCENN